MVDVKIIGIGGFGRMFLGFGFCGLGMNIKRLFFVSGGNFVINLVKVWNDVLRV